MKKKPNSVRLIINSTEIEEGKKVVLLRITIDNLLTFNRHIDNLCRTANCKNYIYIKQILYTACIKKIFIFRKSETFMQRIYK